MRFALIFVLAVVAFVAALPGANDVAVESRQLPAPDVGCLTGCVDPVAGAAAGDVASCIAAAITAGGAPGGGSSAVGDTIQEIISLLGNLFGNLPIIGSLTSLVTQLDSQLGSLVNGCLGDAGVVVGNVTGVVSCIEGPPGSSEGCLGFTLPALPLPI